MFVWHESYSIDNGIIDREHKKLFDLSNAVLQLDARQPDLETFKNLVRDLYKYVQVHFENEHALMVQLEYPMAAYHERKHATIILEMNRYLQTCRRGSDLIFHFQSLADKWVREHILTEDLKFKQFLILKSRKNAINH